MPSSKVALVACPSYDEALVGQAIERGLELIGGLDRFVSSGERILLKPNVLIGDKPESCITTHPVILQSIARIVQKAGARVTYGDSPSFGPVAFNLRRSGLKIVGDRLGIEMADFDHGRMVSGTNPQLIHKLFLANGALDADGIINLPKLKTHGLMRFTGAIKNLFGCVPGTRKSQYHVKLNDPWAFASMLVDIYACLSPRFSLMDGIMAMEGNGPRNGRPYPMGLLIFSTDPVALDATACRLIDLDPLNVPTCAAAEKAGLGKLNTTDIELVGDCPDLFKRLDFKVDRTAPPVHKKGSLQAFLNQQLSERPIIAASKCNRCGICTTTCPVEPKAVDWKNGDKSRPPVFDYKRCIRCFCCQENCPQGAITIENTFLGSALAGR
ncbi:MAG: DUF362 domain-containing protein [Dehalococcoidales bacterium]|nr:DUF362 domain-containing protein [Dehalococcoidales bacterium]